MSDDEEEDVELQTTEKNVKPRSHVICAVPHCYTYGATGISMHNFPNDSKLFAKWKRAIGLNANRASAKCWKVCGKHFKRDDYILPSVPRIRKNLKRGVVPSMNFPQGEMNPSPPMKSTVESLKTKERRSSRHGSETKETSELSAGMLKQEVESDDNMEEDTLPDEDGKTSSPSATDQPGVKDSDDDSQAKGRRCSLSQSSRSSKNENYESKSNRSFRTSSTDNKDSKFEKKLPGTCCIPSCTNNLIETRNDGLNISYYRFPQERSLCEAWKTTCGSYGPELNTRVGRICSVHFKDEDFEGGSASGGKRGLKPRAVPSLYLLHPPEKKPEEPKKRKYTKKSDIKLSDEEVEVPRPIQLDEITIKSEPESDEEEIGGNGDDASGHYSDYFPGEGCDSDEEFEYNKKGKRRKIETRSGQVASFAGSPASNASKKRAVKRKLRACPASKKNFSLRKPVVEMEKLENGVVSAAAEGLVRVKRVKKKTLASRRVLRDLDSDVEAVQVDLSSDDESREGEDEEESDEEVGLDEVGGDTVLMVGADNKEVTVRGPPLRRRPWDDNEDDDEDNHNIVEIKVNPVSSEDEEDRTSEKRSKKDKIESKKIHKHVKSKTDEGTDVKISIDAFESDVERDDNRLLTKPDSLGFKVNVDSPVSSSSEEMDEEKSGNSRRTTSVKEKEHPNQSLINILESDKSEREKIIELVEQRISEHTKIIEGKAMGPQQLADHTKILQGSALVLKTLAEKTKKPVPTTSTLNLPNTGKQMLLKKTTESAKKGLLPKTLDRVQPPPLQKPQPPLLSEDVLLKEDPSVKDLQKFSPLEKVREYDNLMKKYLSVLLDKNVMSKKLGEMKESVKSYETKLMEKQKELDAAKKKIITLQGRIARTHTALSSFLSPNQIKLALQETKKVAWTPEEMLTAFTIKHLSKACYLFLRHKLNYPLPGISSLQRWMTTVSKGQPDAVVASASTAVQEGASNVDDEDLSDHESLFNVDAGDVIIEGTLEEINSHETEQVGQRGGRELSRSVASSSSVNAVGSQQQLRVQSQPRFVKIYKDQLSDKLSLVSRNLSDKVTIHKIPKNLEQNQTKVRPNLDNLARTNDNFPPSSNMERNNVKFSTVYKNEERTENSSEMIVDESDEIVRADDLIEEDFGEVDASGMKMIKLEQNSTHYEEGQSYFTLSDINGLPDAQVVSSNVPTSNVENTQQKYFHQITIDGKIENRLVESDESHHIVTSHNPQLLKALLMDESGKNPIEPVQQVGDDSHQPKLVLLRDPGTGEDIISFLDRDESILNLVANNEGGGGATAVSPGGTVLTGDLSEAGYTVTFLENYVIQETPPESGVQPTITEKA